jgi:hypothetical protein
MDTACLLRFRRGRADSRTLLLALGLSGGLSSSVLAQSVIYQFTGLASSERFGSAVAGVGDVNGDGFPDMAAGAPTAAPAGLGNAGQVKVFSGSNGLLLFVLNGASIGARFGSSVSGGGDVNGDGVSDLVVGAPEAGAGAGEARVFSGTNGALLWALAGTTGTAELFGTSAAIVGDVNGDGHADFLVGAPDASPGGVSTAGEARLFSGLSGALLSVFSGITVVYRMGWSVAGAGDTDGDGVPDLIVGSYSADEASVYSGATGSLLYALQGTGGFGSAVAGGGDFDGDGRAEIIVGAPSAAPGGSTGPGQVRVFSGATGSVLLTLNAPNSVSTFGSAVGGAGDVNADGVPDVVVGAPGATVGGTQVGKVRVLSGSSGATLLAFDGDPSGVNLGYSVSGAGDLNGDGKADVFAGAPFAYLGVLGEVGRAVVLSTIPSPTGIPPGSSLFGAGCPGSSGLVPSMSTVGGIPTSAGNPAFGLHVSNTLPNSVAVLIAGLSFTSWMGVPLPMSLGVFGVPGCQLFVSADFLFTTTTTGPGGGAGIAFVPTPVPAAPSLSGALLHFQWYIVDPGPAPVPGAMSNALQLLVL